MNETIIDNLDGDGALSEEKVMELCKGSRLNTDQNLIDSYTHQEDFSDYLRILPVWSHNHDNFKFADLR